jgi:RNA polymerase sigma-70 factor (ECF subfamily)
MSFSRAEIDALYRQYGPSVLRRARAILGNEAAAKDALQEVFIRAIRAGDGFRGEASPMTWLYRVTTNLCLNQLRDHARRAELLAENAPPPGEGAAVPGHDERLTVARVLARLPEELREIAVYYFVDQMNQVAP